MTVTVSQHPSPYTVTKLVFFFFEMRTKLNFSKGGKKPNRKEGKS